RSWGLVPARNSNGGPPITAKAVERLALESGARLTSHGDRQMLDRPQARPSAPLDLRFVYGQLQFRPPPKQGPERAYSLDACELMPQTEMNTGAEGDVPVRPALEIKLLRMRIGLRIEVRGHQHGNDLLALLQPDTAELELPADVARLGELHRREEPQEFLDREIGPALRAGNLKVIAFELAERAFTALRHRERYFSKAARALLNEIRGAK